MTRVGAAGLNSENCLIGGDPVRSCPRIPSAVLGPTQLRELLPILRERLPDSPFQAANARASLLALEIKRGQIEGKLERLLPEKPQINRVLRCFNHDLAPVFL